MKTSPWIHQQRRFAMSRLAAVPVTLAILVLATLNTLAAGYPNPRIAPINSKPYGKNYSQWAAEWLKWMLSIPLTNSPQLDVSGEDADEGQNERSPVWFLAGNFGGTNEREVFVPTGKALFFPILNQFWVTFPTDPPMTIDEIRDQVRPPMDGAIMSCEIDGKAVANLSSYREDSTVFTATMPDGNVFDHFGFDLPAGDYSPCLDNGYYLMVRPLSRGRHTIHFKGETADHSFALEITYHLNVGKPASVVAPNKKYRGGSYSDWSAKWWQWALSLPVTAHPLFDTADCGAEQSGPVWFLGGKFCMFPAPPGGCDASFAERTCTVPPGKALFFPILDTEDSVIEESHSIGCGGTNEMALHSCAAGQIDNATNLECEIDGVAVSGLDHYRVQSTLFDFTLAAHDNLMAGAGETGIPDGATSQAVSDGYFVMVKPLQKGQHRIHFHGSFTCPTCGDFSLDIIYHITVAP